MKALEIQSVINIVGRTTFGEIVRNAIAGEFGPMECFVSNFHPHDPFRQELRKAVRWTVEHGMPQE